MRRRKRAARRLGALLQELTPQIAAILAFGAGAMMLVSAVTPAFPERFLIVTRATPGVVLELSHFLGSITGFLLLVVAGGLWRRRTGAYFATLGLLSAGALFSLVKGLNYEEAAVLAGLAAGLAPCRAAFTRRSRLGGASLSTGSLLAVAVVVAAALALGFYVYRQAPYDDVLWWTLLRDAEVSGFLRAAAAMAILTLTLTLMVLLAGPRSKWRGHPDPDGLARAAALIAEADDAPADAWLATLGDKDLLFSESGCSFIAFRAQGGRWVAMSEPVGRREEFPALLWRFVEQADAAGAKPVFYAASEAFLPAMASMGLVIRKIGETAAVRVADFHLQGRARQDLRTARNRAEREGATVEVLPAGSAAALAYQLEAVSNDWMERQAGREKLFSLGRFDLAYIDRTPLAVAWRDGRVVAFANLLVSPSRRTVQVDLMRYAEQAPPGMMDALFVGAIEWARAEGYETFELGRTPLAGLEDRRLAPLFARVGALVYEEAEAVYGFQGLRAYKAKFFPEWRPVFLGAAPGVPMPLALLDVALLTHGGWLGLLDLAPRPGRPIPGPR